MEGCFVAKLNQRCKGGCYYEKTTLLWSLFYLAIALFLVVNAYFYAYKFSAIFIITICVAIVPLAFSIQFFTIFLQISIDKHFTKNKRKNKHYDNKDTTNNKETFVK
jgi:amino acid transporter